MDINNLVISAAAKLSLMPQVDIRPEHSLLGDIDIDGDDFSFDFVPSLERSLGIKTHQADWRVLKR